MLRDGGETGVIAIERGFDGVSMTKDPSRLPLRPMNNDLKNQGFH